jgi:predicted phage baseplate assembly protein
MNDCGCCAGITLATPVPASNRPGLDTISYRVGMHGRFLDSMLARLSSPAYPELAGLRARTTDDLAIALLDSWAAVADILTFYAERIANEGYLRTATELESIARLGRLVAYAPRPGLGASVFLAYTLLTDPARDTTVTIPRGARAQSVPGPGELPQSYETATDLVSRASWNILQVRRTQPALITRVGADSLTELHLAGTSTQAKAGDRLLLVFGPGNDKPVPLRVRSVNPDPVTASTTITLQNDVLRQRYTAAAQTLAAALQTAAEANPGGPAADTFAAYLNSLIGDSPGKLTKGDITPEELIALTEAIQNAVDEELAFAQMHAEPAITGWLTPLLQPLDDARQVAGQLLTAAGGPTSGPVRGKGADPGAAIEALGPILGALRRPAGRPPNSPFALDRGPAARFAAGSDAAAQLLIAADPRLADSLYDAWSTRQVGGPSPLRAVQHLRITAAPFGATAPMPPPPAPPGDWRLNEEPAVLCLDAVYPDITPGSWVIVELPPSTSQSAGPAAAAGPTPIDNPLITTVDSVDIIARADYGITGRVTQLNLHEPWLPYTTRGGTIVVDPSLTLSYVRQAVVQAHSIGLKLSPADITDDVAGDTIDLDHPYPGLQPGRWLVVSGERTDIPGTTGVQASELVMLAGVNQTADPARPGETPHSQLLLAAPLGYSYRRGSVQIAGNVAAATQGETRTETLGSGDGGQAGQSFTLRQSPLTWLPAATPAGAAATLEVRVDGVAWHSADTLIDAGPGDHDYVLRTNPDGQYSVVFGDGKHGSRLPTGVENVTASYRVGLGRAGDVNAGQITQLTTRPQGVSAVANPLRASGGADPDDAGLARRNTPLRMLALDRLVSVRDYEDFARARAGIGTASARKLTDGHRQVVHVTVAGADDLPLDDTSLLITTLRDAFAVNGDPYQPVQVASRALLLLVLGAGIHVAADHEWTSVAPAVRAILLDRFGARRRELGQSAYLSDIVAAIQAVAGVDYVDVDTFTGVPGDATPAELAGLAGSLSRVDPVVAARLATYQELTHTVADHDTLTSIAATEDVTVTELLQLNPGLTGIPLTAGTSLVVRRGILPAQLARFEPAVSDTIALHEVLP